MRQAHKNGILPDAFDLAPRDKQILLLAKAQKSARAARHHQCGDGRALGIKLQFRGKAQARAVAQVNNFLPF